MFEKRKKARLLRKSLDKKTHSEFSREICEKLNDFLNNKSVIMVYSAIDGEVDLSYIFKNNIENFLFPRVEGEEIVAVKGENFVDGSYGISEPCGICFYDEIDVVVVPMCAFDREFNRLGFGKGYYDRFLKDRKCLKIGVAFSCQETENILFKDTDVKMDIIITEKEILKR